MHFELFYVHIEENIVTLVLQEDITCLRLHAHEDEIDCDIMLVFTNILS